MNILIDALPSAVQITNLETGRPAYLPIRSGHTSCIRAVSELLDGDADAAAVFDCMLPELPAFRVDWDELFQAIIRFLVGAPIPALPGQKGSSKSSERTYSYVYDQDAIFAAFLQQYHIDITQVDMHWWKFLALLHNLQDNSMADRIRARAAQESSGMTDEQRRYIREEKQRWRLPQLAAETAQEDAIVAALKNGGIGLEEALGRA